MNKAPKAVLPDGGTDWDRRLKTTLDTYFYALSESISRAADGYVHETTSVSTAHTATINESVVIVDTTSGNKSLVLPAADQSKGKRITIKNKGSNNVLVTGALIENVTVKTVATLASLDLVTDGTNWWSV